MATIKFINERYQYSDDDALHDVLRYCQNASKTNGYIGGWSINPTNAYVEMSTFSKLANQNSGKRLRHIVLAFKPETIVNPDMLFDLASDVTKFFSEEYQVFFALHFNKEHPHIHIVLNVVNIFTLKKFNDNHQFYRAFMNHIKRMMRKYNIKDYLHYVPKNSSDNRY